MKEGYTAGTLPELIDIGKEIHLHNKVHLATNSMQRVKHWNPAGEDWHFTGCIVEGLLAQRIQIDVYLADGVICRVRIMIHKPDLQRLVL